ncbi:uncharacterized protein Z519_00250 [Cladophialophora bantiana CBS 173.52]|uniref:Uncharacterized protein n=1 Tax=Cladophialophora bantiana (strain ATCC 10958 / CBS 173.52 / CDC B-1940 / NIH 8579) TaxID=1442370 RepID=A0A0D2IPB1_CLAB1|nr:uncharacterized protein Z519_00250 [Cladophialophora bantiana CBS 173.52]KIW98589.1 hypothetical protein Z519_00250 [Cladophialophora bantiana CBS 173.52]
MPDEAADSFTDMTGGGDVLRIHLNIRASTQGTAYSVYFAQYAPGGLGRFLGLGQTHIDSLQQIFVKAESLQDAFQASAECLVAIIKHHWDSLSPKEIANVVWYHDEDSSFIFSKGELQVVGYESERQAWEEGLYEGEMHRYPVDNPVVSEIIEKMKLVGTWKNIGESGKKTGDNVSGE